MDIIGAVKDLFSIKKKVPYYDDIIAEATKWIGIHEKKGEQSKSVNPFRKAVDNVADGEPWCAAFVGYCVRSVALRKKAKIGVHLSELSTDMWYKTPSHLRSKKPLPGSIVIWKYPNSVHGHTGFVASIKGDKMLTIEGNTKAPGDKTISGTGVYSKSRSIYGTDSMPILGFVIPFER